MSSFIVQQAGMLSLLQDAGRFGAHHIGLTTGGPVDKLAFKWANRLCSNELDATTIEITLGGIELIAQGKSKIAVTGADVPLTINGKMKALWRSHYVNDGDVINLGFASKGMRAYLAVTGGFQVKASFGSAATVCREKIGGLDGGKLNAGNVLAITAVDPARINSSNVILVEKHRPTYSTDIVLRTILGYQQQNFSALAKQLFFNSEFTVSEHCDRMGYRLNGEKISANIEGILSEGICAGAIQIPADGQPIVLLNDRQTIGGYPKIGSVIALDTAKLAQLGQGAKISFAQISIEDAHNINHLAQCLFYNTQLQQCD
ncbi:MAG: allophanate hydrolase [Gammaproteobacteria bacterium]|nr:MAG: allophanate hydrolase [Gammaproteobacteria bacterium]